MTARVLFGMLASTGLLLVLAGPAGAVTTDYSSFESYLTADQVQQFQALTASQQAEMYSIFTDPSVFDGESTTAQLETQYPGIGISDPSYTPVSSDLPLARGAETAAVYNVHSWYHHTVSFLFISNTASLDYYYQTGSGRVLSDQKCTWHDSGITSNEINNISTNMYISGSNGYCSADVQFAEFPYFVWKGYLDQSMSVNYKGIYSKSFHQHS